ncbi:MAG: hypothetical protein KKE17_13955 [Proteobacteria bacterium]|nr:hypothetical protein [Pseudomonadota bacterium]MBU1711103.1 hypothetical protein [Pseudomonadota bacterium]
MRTTRVLFNQINYLDDTFSLSPANSDHVPDELRESIQRVGILHLPILLARESGSYLIVTGKKRLLACREIFDQLSCDCMVLSEKTSNIDALAIALEEMCVSGKINVIGKAIFFKKALQWIDEKTAAEKFLPVMGLPLGSFQIKRLLNLLDLEDHLLLALENGVLDETVAREMLKMPFVDRMTLFETIEFLHLSVGNQRKITSICQELAARNRTNIIAILSDAELRDILQNQETNPPQKTQHLMARLTEKKQPRLTEAESQFKELRSSLALPGNITLAHSQAFETDGLTLSVNFNNRHELVDTWEKIRPQLTNTKTDKSTAID